MDKYLWWYNGMHGFIWTDSAANARTMIRGIGMPGALIWRIANA